MTRSEETLRFLLDQVGADRVVLGSDWPFPRCGRRVGRDRSAYLGL